MAHREREYASISQCPFEAKLVDSTGAIASSCKEEKESTNNSLQECIGSSTNAIVRLQPTASSKNQKQDKKPTVFRWDKDTHFHEELRVPSSTTKDDDKDCSLCLTMQVRAREGIAVALSPTTKFVSGDTYEIFLGDRGNTLVSLQRKPLLEVQRPARLCQENAWQTYWICLYHGKLYVGIGEKPGEHCVAFLDDISRHDLPPATEDRRVKYIGIGNAGIGDRQAPVALKIRRIQLSRISPQATDIIEKLKNIQETNLEFVNLGSEAMDDEAKAALLEYHQECQKARARAEKFGVAYKEPPTFIPWSQARRLRANPQPGFITGLDTANEEEKAKQDARKKRFGIETGEAQQPATDTPCLPTEEAWDNEELVGPHRTDPPSHLWNSSESTTQQTKGKDEATFADEKIHLFSIDWAAFKQIRTRDIMHFFSQYSPTYVEWLGDLSCNVHFADKYSALRALNNLSTEIPSPVDFANAETKNEKDIDSSSKCDLGQMGWRLGKTLLQKTENDRFGRKGTKARILLRRATTLDILIERPSSWPKAPPGFSTKEILGPGSDFSRPKQAQDKSRNSPRKQNKDNKSSNKKKAKEQAKPQKKTNKRKKKTSTQQQEATASNKATTKGGVFLSLDQGLQASRDGFSTEQLEQERAKKKAKQN